MKKLTLFVFGLAFAASVRADDQLRQVQQSLKDGGFYYGEVDGEEGTETNAAVRRYQIRNGLEVTGKLNPETLGALHIGNAAPAPPEQPVAPPAPAPPAIVESDKNFLREKPAPPEPEEPAAPTPPPAPVAPPLASLFQRTPYERAPVSVQRDALRRAQVRLSRDGFYRGPIDGEAGPDTQGALMSYQRDADLPPTGRLDMATLADMNLLPSRRMVFPDRSADDFDEPPAPQRRVFRGIWVR